MMPVLCMVGGAGICEEYTDLVVTGFVFEGGDGLIF